MATEVFLSGMKFLCSPNESSRRRLKVFMGPGGVMLWWWWSGAESVCGTRGSVGRGLFGVVCRSRGGLWNDLRCCSACGEAVSGRDGPGMV